MSRKTRVLLDLDSIVVDIEGPWYREYNRRFGDDLSIEKVTEWDTAKFAKAGARVFDILHDPGFYESLEPLPGAVGGVEELTADPRAEVYIVSSAPTVGSYSEKAAWVKRWLPSIDLKRLVLTYSKSLVAGDVLFDDGPHNLLAYAEDWPAARLATIAYPYNHEARSKLDYNRLFVAGHYQDTEAAWKTFTTWIKEVIL